jgi:hypothetical protein
MSHDLAQHIGQLLTSKDVREGILLLQDALLMLPQSDFPLRHYYADGQYAREMFIGKNKLLVGKIHKHSHINILSMGECTVVTEFGIQRLKAPLTFVSPKMTKRAIFAHKDTLWTTVHVTDKTNLDEIEDEVIAKDYSEFDEIAFERNLSLASRHWPVVKRCDETTDGEERTTRNQPEA